MGASPVMVSCSDDCQDRKGLPEIVGEADDALEALELPLLLISGRDCVGVAEAEPAPSCGA